MNPLVNWIWAGVGIVILGTLIALVPPLLPVSRRVEVLTPAPSRSSDSGALPLAAKIAVPEAPHA